MSDDAAVTFLTAATTVGRVYGEREREEHYDCFFDVVLVGGEPAIQIRGRATAIRTVRMRARAVLLVQLFTHPETLWLAEPIIENGELVMVYMPLEPLVSLDGRLQLPILHRVTSEQVNEAVNNATSFQLRPDRYQ